MERITYKSFMGDYGSNVIFEDDRTEIYALRNALGKYEDIGLTPEEIMCAIKSISKTDFYKQIHK